MKTTRTILAALTLALSTTTMAVGPSFPPPFTQTYGLHLFFNEKEFVDVVELSSQQPGQAAGMMHVPNDFDGPLANIVQTPQKISFDVLVPRNSARPQDLIFHYEGTFFDATHKQITGFVTIRGQAAFIASFVAFLRAPNGMPNFR